jgi:hypothetical protein
VRLQVETITASVTAVLLVKSNKASATCSGAKATCSRNATGAVLWLMPSAKMIVHLQNPMQSWVIGLWKGRIVRKSMGHEKPFNL